MKRAALVLMLILPLVARAETNWELESRANATLDALYANSPDARALGARAKGVLVFPDVRTSSLDVGARSGEGVLFIAGAVAGHYSVGDLDSGVETGAESYSYAIFFMTDAALERLGDSSGLDPSLDPEMVVLEIGARRELPGLIVEPW